MSFKFEVKTGGAYGTHIFVDANIEFNLKIGDTMYQGEFQTGHSYDHQDYGYPSNIVSVYDDDSVLYALDNCREDYEEFERDSGLCISEEEFNHALSELEELRDEAQAEVDARLQEIEEKISSDKRVYVSVYYTEDGNQCSPTHSMRFETEDEMEAFTESEINTVVNKVSVEEGLSLHDEFMSNFTKNNI